MPPQPKPLPPGLTEWVESQNPKCYAKFIKPEYVTSDAWNGTVYIFELRQPRTFKSVFHLKGCAFALDQFHLSPEWTWQLIGGPEIPNAKSAVLHVLKNSN